MMFYDHDMSGWGYAGMAIGMVLFWVLVIAGIVVLIRYAAGTPQTRAFPQPQQYSVRESPEQMLAVRFARGEIDETEYRHRLDVLRSVPYHAASP